MLASRRIPAIAWLISTVAAALICAPPSAAAYDPESPEVRAMVKKALAHLEQNSDNRLGGKCLVGLAFYKNGAAADHPRIEEAVKACQSAARRGAEKVSEDIYSTGLAVIFLCDLDAARHRSTIDTLLVSLELRQKKGGGWGYPGRKTGDTSMTQYAVLATWLAYQNNISVSLESVEKVCGWLIRTQDPSGGWGYQGNDPGDYERVEQDSVRRSLTSAGLGSLYACADLLRFYKTKQKDKSLPAALTLVEDRNHRQLTDQIPEEYLRRAIADGNAWLAGNYAITQDNWQYYYMYALERCMSFRQHVLGEGSSDLAWYDDGVEFLQKKQSKQGTWSGGSGREVSTAFGVLFLLQSTRRSLKEKTILQGMLVGGRGLPKNADHVRLEGGRVIDSTLDDTLKNLSDILGDADPQALDHWLERPAAVVPKENGDSDREVNPWESQSRELVVRAIGRSGDITKAPLLIDLLTHDDPAVVREARDALRFLSRKFEGFGLPDRSTPEERRKAADQWRAWYYGVFPEAQLEN